MPNNITQLLDVVTPEVFNEYMNNFTEEKSAIIQSGVAVNDETVSKNITAGGLLVNMPFWNDLDGEDETLGDGEKSLSTGKITASADIAAVMYRGRGWSVNELAAVASGDDPLDALLGKIASWWLRREQTVLISVLNGLFAKNGALASSHLLSKPTAAISGDLVLDAKQMLGDSADRLSLMVMHSAVYTALQKQNLIVFIPSARGEINIPTYLGYRVVVDDGVPTSGPKAATVYTSYLFATGAIGRNPGNPSRLTTYERARDASKGNDQVFTRRAFTMHPYGVKFTNAQRDAGEITPTNADLAKAGNWEKVYEDKQIGIVGIQHLVEELPTSGA
ncbi:TPA: coat protein [Listeria monocytogenes]|uniref:major capsid protein n=1 Tax=Listeria monocytogenes TaxID=1639 RepID=UPI00164FDEC0|nr:major capsid protein [Listeria monocytogenes]MBC6362252.1 coat protein [Listeria monocytogenes]HCY9071759.1 coat protein [Listeria monocytogenes]